MYNYDYTKGTLTFPCKFCGEFNKMEVWYNLDSRKYPEQKQRVLNKEFFLVECQKCKHKYHLAYEMMYHDVDNKVIIYLDPMMQYTKQIMKKIRQQKKELGKDYRFRIVKSVNDIYEKASFFEYKYDDRIVELIVGEIVANTSYSEKNLNIERVVINATADLLEINLLGVDTNTGEEFDLPFGMDKDLYRTNALNTYAIMKLKESLIVDFEWCIEQRKKMKKKLEKIIKRKF